MRLRIKMTLGSTALVLASFVLVLILLPHGVSQALADSTSLQGTGATFPAPLYERWFAQYNQLHPEVQINYQALGSGAGIKQLQQHLVDFAASDAAMTDAEMASVKEGVVLIPMTAGSIVLAYNLPDGPAALKLSREAYVGIFLGKITQWNDPAIAKSNPDSKLPDTKITAVTRSDGSGTTFAFTTHLSGISDAWKNGPGIGKSVNFPASVAGKGNTGVAALIKQTPGAIGYVEYGYAKQTSMPMASLENKAGKFVQPSLATARDALATVQFPPNLRAWVPDPSGDDSYPIVTFTWMLFYKHYDKPAVVATLKSLVLFGLDQGQTYSESLGYVPLPASVVAADKAALKQIS